VLAGKRIRFDHGHLAIAAGFHHAQGVRVYSSENCGLLSENCESILERKNRFNENGALVQINALAGWRYFAVGAGLEVV
jgi:hypothetical protein